MVDTASELAWVRRYRILLAREADALCKVVADELGKPAFETLASEIIPLLSACRWAEKRANRLLRPRRVPGGGVFQLGQSHRVARAPLGDVAIIATWNYPLQLLGVQLVHAVVGGNRVWVKPSEKTPRSQGLLLDLAVRAGLGPERLVRTKADRAAGERLLAENRFDHVVFTGSTEVGRSIATTTAATLTPSTLELSGSDSAIVLGDADIGLAARSIGFALELNAGQTCMAPRRVLVERAVFERFAGAFRAALAEPRERTTPRPDECARTRSLATQAVEACNGAWMSGEDGEPPFVVGWSVGREYSASGLFLGSHFGPGIAVIAVDSSDQALAVHRTIPQRLATAVFTRETRRAETMVSRLGSTVVTINDCVIPTGHPGLGIGGIGDSGWGVSRGEQGLLSMTRPVFVSRTSRFVRTPTAEPSDAVKRRIARVVRWLYG